jgi:hypothetical protein
MHSLILGLVAVSTNYFSARGNEGMYVLAHEVRLLIPGSSWQMATSEGGAN